MIFFDSRQYRNSSSCNSRYGSSAAYFVPCGGMLDHPITVVLNVSDTSKNNGLKVYKFMCIQTQEVHIGHIKQSKSDRFQDR